MRLLARSAALLFACVVAYTPGHVSAQMENGAQSAAVGSPMDPAKALDSMLGLFQREVTGVVNAMPAEKFSFAPAAGDFTSAVTPKYDGVRTFAQEITHVIQANYFFYGAVSGLKPDVDVKAIGSMTSKDQIVPALEASFAFAHRAVATITPANAFVTIKGADGMQTRATLAAFAVAHGFDHYGQMVEYLRMNGIVPPGSK